MKNFNRRNFIFSAAGIAGVTLFGRSEELESQGRKITLKGKEKSGINHWDVITIGNLSRNRYWGESDEKPLRSAICTCSVVSGKNFHLLIDPSLKDVDEMATELDRRTGLSLEEIDTVFITHQHDDHLYGLKHFTKARWFAGPEVAAALNKSGKFDKLIEPAAKSLLGEIDVIPMFGHTNDSYGLRFDFNGYSIVIAGDAVASKDYWDDNQMYYNVNDLEVARKTLAMIRSMADIIVPGHDNYFLNF
ncbi:MAG TPA: MBL fold metallo-hydrolase [Bacteroidales bacterium]|nr:MBL fold metallo-hydrolase [Bacteroidales bacterium]